jgi:hypothetical protein
VVARDVAGNEGVLEMNVRNSGEGREVRWWAVAPWTSEINGLYFRDDLMVGEPVHTGGWDGASWAARERDLRGKIVELQRPMRTMWSPMYVTLVPADTGAAVEVPRLEQFAGPERSRRLGPPGNVKIVLDEGTLYGDAVVYAAPEYGIDADKGPGLSQRSHAVRIGPYSLSLRSDMSIRFDVDAADTTDAVYRLTERTGRWAYYRSTTDGDTVSTKARRPGVYAVFSDTTPPAIRPPAVASRRIYATGERMREIVVAIDDAGSGVDYDRCAILLAGVQQIARWDVSTRKFFILVRDENIMGPQALTVVAYDNIGHRSQLAATIDIPRRTRR